MCLFDCTRLSCGCYWSLSLPRSAVGWPAVWLWQILVTRCRCFATKIFSCHSFEISFIFPYYFYRYQCTTQISPKLSTKQGFVCLAQVHNAVPLMRLKPATPRSRVKHSTTEPQHSHQQTWIGLNILLLQSNVLSNPLLFHDLFHWHFFCISRHNLCWS